ncbi:hypothetical protein HYH03_009758 [Edaphochlamys debaryana]|uniref:Ppx/GppA phosphatase domain-containing protein n=1 Tax=Edaphochlamys debaryana TaxID=47281 RepID=A0A835XYB8_9CHLO|nr:hypothetical protein HYH03_009758 [Edaphochlamys debaryana]|eukprot:KAG2492029.1 hypothetical protein HYH03_009758 [Edaphochlamys debaryana]
MASWQEEWTRALERPGAGSAEAVSSSADALFPAPSPHHHVSAAERDEWDAVLGSREATFNAGPVSTPRSPGPGTRRPGPGQKGPASPPDLPTTSRQAPPRRVFAAIELGSHCTRALLHDGRSELARLSYDTLLGKAAPEAQAQAQALPGPARPGLPRLASGGAELAPEAVERTLSALRCVVAAAAEAASKLGGDADTEAAAAGPAAAGGKSGAVGVDRCSGRSEDSGAVAVEGRGVELVGRMVGTAAVRNASASSRAALAEAAERITGCALEVLSGEDEGRLAWRGVTCTAVGGAVAGAALGAAGPSASGGPAPAALLLVDMGGRSTEFIYGHRSSDRPAAVSVTLGCVGLSAAAARFDGSGEGAEGAARSPSLGALLACADQAQQTILRRCSGEPWWPAALGAAACTDGTGPPPPPPATVILTGGTATTLAALQLQLPAYDRDAVHGSQLTTTQIVALMTDLSRPGGVAAALGAYPWLTPERGRSLAAGCAGLLGVVRALQAEACVVSDADGLDGLMAEVLEREAGRGGGGV